ncbi:class I SAM-dependent methyltransferase [Microvirga sp. CF3016]|uniref:class I SAM-dependent methyltransferase n=1 Tax=Microvirga sp. CF3016 TaxID=3110181 RepID=UPI002E771651|nr:class I SAM-dependent methyltransferase [Microvirga sp. CF3016]MEE1612174.1 class I SAM-dependent methyltransferase [Microvirga sp. CF3016]
MSDAEVDRIRQAYENYRKHGKWNSPNAGRDYMISEGYRELRNILNQERRHSLAEARILDIGCGNGTLLSRFSELGAQADNLFGIDLVADRIAAARNKHPEFTFEVANAEALNFPNESFNLISAFTVFSSVLDESMSDNIARTITRLLKPDGAIIWYDLRYPNPQNPNVKAMTKARIRRLFPDFTLNLRSTTLLPPIAERLGRHTEQLYPLFKKVPVLRSHYIGTLSKR